MACKEEPNIVFGPKTCYISVRERERERERERDVLCSCVREEREDNNIIILIHEQKGWFGNWG